MSRWEEGAQGRGGKSIGLHGRERAFSIRTPESLEGVGGEKRRRVNGM